MASAIGADFQKAVPQMRFEAERCRTRHPVPPATLQHPRENRKPPVAAWENRHLSVPRSIRAHADRDETSPR